METHIEKNIIGGKASNLIDLTKLGYSVPEFIILTSKELEENTFHSKLDNFINPTDHYAVRSSANIEDGKEHSFAGQFSTMLNIKGTDIIQAVIAVYSSKDSDNVKNYLDVKNISLKVQMAVIVQKMIPSEVSGVAFGRNPSSPDPDQKIITAAWGLGEAIVSGLLETDTWTIYKNSITPTIGSKKEQLVYDKIKQLNSIFQVPQHLQEQACLTDQQILRISKILADLERHFNHPQDIEFSIFNDQVHLLQTRPITTWIKPKGEKIVWDNSNIIESYPGITTPATFSFIQKMYAQVYFQFCELMGVERRILQLEQKTLDNMLGLIQGRVYYNLKSWYQLLSLLPGYKMNARFMETMMGVTERFELKQQSQPSKIKAKLTFVKSLFKIRKEFKRLPLERAKFQANLNNILPSYTGKNFSKQSISETLKDYSEFEAKLLSQWRAPLVNDFFAMIYYGLLQKLSLKWLPSQPNIHNDLLCGSNDIISTLPAKRLLELAAIIQNNNDLKNAILNLDWDPKNSKHEFELFKSRFNQYIELYGDRCIGELKLESPTFKQRPALLIEILKTYVEQDIEPKNTDTLEQSIREKAETNLHNSLRGWKKRLFQYVLRKTRELISARENLRFERTKAFAIVKNMYRGIGKQLLQVDIIQHEEDIFYLTLPELTNYANGTLSKYIIQANIQARKEVFQEYNKQTPPDRFTSWGPVESPADIYENPSQQDVDFQHQGIGACPGEVTGTILKVRDPKTTHSAQGKIIAARSTDPGWITILPSCSGLIVERGSVLSHSAIVSRELGIPCIVGVKGLMDKMEDGIEITMNGGTGQFNIIKPTSGQ